MTQPPSRSSCAHHFSRCQDARRNRIDLSGHALMMSKISKSGVRDVTLAGWMFTGRPLWLVGSWWATNLGWPLEYCFYRLLLYSFLAFHIIIHHLLNIIEWIYGQLISNYLTNKWWFTWVAAFQVRTFQVAAPVFAAQSYGPFGAMAQVELARGHLSHETYRPVDWLIQVVY